VNPRPRTPILAPTGPVHLKREDIAAHNRSMVDLGVGFAIVEDPVAFDLIVTR